MRVIPLMLCVLLPACGGTSETSSDPEERFYERLEAGAECPELFDLRNELDPKDPEIETMNDALQDVGCASSSDTRSTSEVDNTREIAELLCRDYGPKATAKEYGVSDPRDFEAIAEAYSMDSISGAHRDAAYEGCLEGLEESKKP